MTDTPIEPATCPRCGGQDIYTSQGVQREFRDHRMTLEVTPKVVARIDIAICVGCGHFEERVAMHGSSWGETVAAIREKWRKV